jgi:endonuclease/exonuclease/phosphatase family metal-dependent hydrolase
MSNGARSRRWAIAGLTIALSAVWGAREPAGQSGYAGSPLGGAPLALPGTVQAANYDVGGEGVAYGDTTPGNTGGAYRGDDVDIEVSSEGGYDVGWTASGEWLNYTVSVANAGSYTTQIRVASPSGAAMHIGFNGPSSVWSSVSVPATGGWQNWTTVTVPVTLGAGTQQMTILFDTGGMNLESITVAADSGGGGSGSTVSVATWNIEINDGSESHARTVIDNLLAIGPQPQIIVIQEAYSSWFSTYIDELQLMTGQAWQGVFATHCEAGQWNGSWCSSSWDQGVGIFTTFNITDSSSTFFPFPDCWTSARAGLRAAINVNGTPLQVFTTHLQTGGCSDDALARDSSMAALKAWAAGYSAPQLVAGDFNADPDQIDVTSGMAPNFVDSWSVVGSGPGDTGLDPTNPTMKLDYWLADWSGRAQPQSSQVISWTGWISDHLPLQATFVIK